MICCRLLACLSVVSCHSKMTTKMMMNILTVLMTMSIGVCSVNAQACDTGGSTRVSCRNQRLTSANVTGDRSKVQTLNLRDNSIIYLPLGVFDELVNLQELDLSSNPIVSLPLGVFDKLVNLTSLSLTRNLISSLPLGVVDKLVNLQSLDFSYNSIASLPLGVFDKLVNLQKLWFYSNRITSIPPGVFDKLVKLTLLSLDANPATNLDCEFTNCIGFRIIGNVCFLRSLTEYCKLSYCTVPPRIDLIGAGIGKTNSSGTYYRVARTPCQLGYSDPTPTYVTACSINIGRPSFTNLSSNCADIDECLVNNSCNAKISTCNNTIGSYRCDCFDGFKQVNNLTCDCFDGYQQVHNFTCTDVDECQSSPCHSKSACNNTDGSFTCYCNQGYTGNGFICTDVNECQSSPCHWKSACNNTDGSFTCLCNQGYTGNGVVCTELYECSSYPCQNGLCRDSVNSFTCQCSAGFTGSSCETEINECDPLPCENNGTCTDLTNKYLCNCMSGYTSQNCSKDVDECVARSHSCHSQAICSNEPGSYECVCKQGYSGNGFTCKLVSTLPATVINEAAGTANPTPPGNNGGAAAGTSPLASASLGTLIGVIIIAVMFVALAAVLLRVNNKLNNIKKEAILRPEFCHSRKSKHGDTSTSLLLGHISSSFSDDRPVPVSPLPHLKNAENTSPAQPSPPGKSMANIPSTDSKTTSPLFTIPDRTHIRTSLQSDSGKLDAKVLNEKYVNTTPNIDLAIASRTGNNSSCSSSMVDGTKSADKAKSAATPGLYDVTDLVQVECMASGSATAMQPAMPSSTTTATPKTQNNEGIYGEIQDESCAYAFSQKGPFPLAARHSLTASYQNSKSNSREPELATQSASHPDDRVHGEIGDAASKSKPSLYVNSTEKSSHT